MAKSYIHELGDRLSKNSTAENLPGHIKEIAPVMYNDGNNNYASIQSALNGKASATHTHGNITNGGTLTDTAAAAAGNDYVVIRDADNAKIQTSTIKGTDVADAVSKKHSHSTLTLSTTAQAYDGSHTLALPSTDPYTSARTPASHTHGNITNGGALQTNDVTIASGDKLVVTDASDSNKVARTSVSFDGSTTGTLLSKKGTWENPKEAYLAWGGRNHTGNFGPLDGALVSELGANRFACGNAAGITIEYTRDGGTTWVDYGASDLAKRNIFTNRSSSIIVGKANSTDKATTAENYANYKVRVIIKCGTFGIYNTFEKFVFYVSTNGSAGCYMKMSGVKQAETSDVWTTIGEMQVSGWSGYNVYNKSVSMGASSYATYKKICFLFECRAAGETTYNGLSISSIWGYGGVGWTTPSTMASTGHAYSINGNQAVTFPSTVTATGFSGPLTGNASSASKLSTARKLAVSLSNTSTDTSFDGSADVTNIKTTGTLQIANGGTGATTKKAAEYAINGGMSEATAAMADNFQIVFSRVGTDQNATNGVFIYRQASTVWNYIKNKLSSDTGVNISGNAVTATTATKLGSSTLGSSTKPIYLSSGTATECSTYAGGTAVTLNGTSKSASTASFYAPTGAGTSGQLLKSSGSGAPTWATANAALVGITVTSSSVSDGTNTFNKYTHPTTSGNKHVPSGGSSGQFLGWDSDGTAKWVANPNTDTKNTAGSTDTSSKIFLIGATSQAANPQTYSQDTTYVDTDATLASTKVRVAEKCTLQFNTTTNALDFVFA